MEAFPALSWKIQNFYVNQQMPRIPGELVAKRTIAKKKRAQIQRTQICSLPPPIATNMEVNPRIVTLVNVEEKKYIYFYALR